MKPKSFNLIDDPWLPVHYPDGRYAELGLRDALRDAPQIRDLAIAFPLEYVATLRMVVTILQSACGGPGGPREKARWLDGHAGLQPTLEAYFAEWRDRFELFHPERPFMQAPLGTAVPAATIAALRPDWASGNNATLFDHHADARPEPLAPGSAARALLTTLLFQPGGGASKPFNRTDSPATKALQVLVEGRDLWETLVMNTPIMLDEAASRPIWEQPSSHDAARADRGGTTPDGWLDRATWRSRAVQLVSDEDGRVGQVRLHQHLKLSDAPPFDPYAPVRRAEGRPPVVVKASPNKALWRDAEALIAGLRPASDHPSIVAQALDALDTQGETRRPGIRVVGQVVNQAKVADVRDGRMPMSRALLEDDARLEIVGSLVEAAESAAKALRAAIKRATNEMGAADGWGRATRWETDYWARLAAPFHTRLRLLARLEGDTIRDEILVPWRAKTATAAQRMYDRFSSDGAGGRAPRAIGLARAELDRQLAQRYPTRGTCMSKNLRSDVAARLSRGLVRMQHDAEAAKPAAVALRAALRRGVHGSFGDDARADAALLGAVRLPVDDEGELPAMDARLGRLLDDAALVGALVAATRVRVHEPKTSDEAPRPNSRRSLGRDLRAISVRRPKDALLSAMLRSSREQLPAHLRRALTLMADDGAALDVYALLTDLEWWDADDRWVQKRWAYHFWSQPEPRDRDDADIKQDDETA